ncbi:MAG: glycosyltransferase family 2 protein [Myxococcota bacterium]
MAEPDHILTIVIPALNEEEAIGTTIERCLEARQHIVDTSPVKDVEIVVVSDGSTDRTEEIARSFPEVTVLVFIENRGYGAAIKTGFAHGSGDLVSFLDADGTCDPRFFADLCQELDAKGADLALGSRMGPNSEMPLIRTVGNTLFAWMLGLLAHRRVQDTASGMRVIRRSALPDLYPLPDGLHFTPAMSARVLLEDKLELIELPMAYAERQGRSKLSVVKDGVRFLTCILQGAVTFRPARPLGYVAGALALLATLVGSEPLLYWLRKGELLEPMIYKVLMASLLTTFAGIVGCAAIVADRVAAAAHYRPATRDGVIGWVSPLFSSRWRLWGVASLAAVAVLVSLPGIGEWLTEGEVAMHWSRAAFSSLMLMLAAMLGVTSFLLNMVELIEANRLNAPTIAPPDRQFEAKAPGH